MVKANYSLFQSSNTDEILRGLFYSIEDVNDCPDLQIIFEVALKNRALFPGIPSSGDDKKYLEKWVSRYVDSNILPSLIKASPKVPCNNPAISVIIGNTGQLDLDSIQIAERLHVLYMSAENVHGKLLEEYIANNIHKYGFVWCKGSVLYAVDFCNKDGSCLIQVKNKNNTENSSSSAIRRGTSILHWYRLSTFNKNGKHPVFHWDDLNSIIEQNKCEGMDSTCCMCEEDYEEFLKNVASSNPDIISSD